MKTFRLAWGACFFMSDTKAFQLEQQMSSDHRAWSDNEGRRPGWAAEQSMCFGSLPFDTPFSITMNRAEFSLWWRNTYGGSLCWSENAQ